MNNIFKAILIVCVTVMTYNCSKTYKVEDPDASFIAYKLDADKVRLENSTEALTVQMFTKTIDGIDQHIAFVEFEFTGSGDLTSIWTGDSCTVRVPVSIDGATGEVTQWENRKLASDYDRYKDGEFGHRGQRLTDRKLVYTYWKAGTYKATMVATNWGEMDSDEMKRDEKSIIITVQD